MKIDSTIVFLVFLIASRCWRAAHAVSDELVAFQKALVDAKAQLLSIRDTEAIRGNAVLLRQRRAAIDELLGNYQQDLNFDLDQEALENAAADYPDHLLDNRDCKGGDCMKFPEYRLPGGKAKKKTSLSDELNALVRVNTRFRDLHKGMLNAFHKTNNNNAGLVDLSTLTANSGDDTAKNPKVSASVNVNLSGRINPSEPAKVKSNSKTNINSDGNKNANNDNPDAIVNSISNAAVPSNTANANAKTNLFSNTNFNSNANSYSNTKGDFNSNSNSFSNSNNNLNSFSNANSKLNSFSNSNNNLNSFSNSNFNTNADLNANINSNSYINAKFDSVADTNMNFGNGPQCKASSNANKNNKYENNDLDMNLNFNTNDSPKANTNLNSNTNTNSNSNSNFNFNSNDQPTYISCVPLTNGAKSNTNTNANYKSNSLGSLGAASFKDIPLSNDNLQSNGSPQPKGNPRSSIDNILMLESDTVRNKIHNKNNDDAYTGLNYIENNNYNGQSNGYTGSDYYGSNDNFYSIIDTTSNNNKNNKDNYGNKNLNTLDFNHFTNYETDRDTNDKGGNDDDEVFTYEKTIENIHFPSIVNDQFDLIKNDLSHEANYKLSKIEQDAAERKKIPGAQRQPAGNKEVWNLRNPSVKRSAAFNPMDEIKLKTSARLMSKGLGPSLPSYALADTWRELQLDESVKKLEQDFNEQPKHEAYDKYDTLLSVDEQLWRQRMKRLDELEQKSLETMLHIPELDRADNTLNTAESTKEGTDADSVLPDATFDFLRTKRLSELKADDKLQLTQQQLDQPLQQTLPMQQQQQQQQSQQQQQQELQQLQLTQQQPAPESLSNPGEIKVITLPDVVELSSLETKPFTVDKEDDGKSPSREATETRTLPDGNAGGVVPSKRCGEGATKAATDDQIFKTNSDSGNDGADLPKRRVKRIGVLNGEGVMTEVKEMNAEFMDDLVGMTRTKRAVGVASSSQKEQRARSSVGAKREKSARVLKRRKRSIGINDDEVFQDDVENSLDASRFRRSLDATHKTPRSRQRRIRRSVAATCPPAASTAAPPATTTDAATRKVKKRSTQLADEIDDNNSNNRKVLDSALVPVDAGVSAAGGDNAAANAAVDEAAHEENYADVIRKKRISDREFDLSGSVGEFGSQKFDNLKQRDERVHSFDGIKVDNLWYPGGNRDDKSNNNRRDNEMEANKIRNQNKELHDTVDVENESVRNAESSSGESNNNEENGRSNDEPKSELSDDERIEADARVRSDKQPEKKMVLALRDQILNCTAFSNLESFLRTLQQQNKTDGGGAAEGGDKMAVQVQVNPAKTPSKFLPKGSAGDESKKSHHHKQSDMMKLNITINASVLGDHKAKNFFGNGTFKVQSEERERRGISFDELGRFTKRKCPKVEKPSCGNAQVDSLASGKVSTEMVKSMFSLVKCNPKLRTLWPSLRRNQLSLSSEPHELNAVSSMDKDDANRVEEMVEKAMEAINDIIQDEVEARSCVPLRSDLKGFYEQILQMYKPDSTRDKRDSLVALTNDFSKQVRAIDPNKIEEKSRIVKKLLRQYDDLSMEDQQRMTDLRQDLLQNLFYLRRLQEEQVLQAQEDDMQERRRRELDDEREMRQLEMDEQQLQLDQMNPEQQLEEEQRQEREQQQGEDDLLKKLGADLTPQYLKLLKASELNSERAAEEEERH